MKNKNRLIIFHISISHIYHRNWFTDQSSNQFTFFRTWSRECRCPNRVRSSWLRMIQFEAFLLSLTSKHQDKLRWLCHSNDDSSRARSSIMKWNGMFFNLKDIALSVACFYFFKYKRKLSISFNFFTLLLQHTKPAAALLLLSVMLSLRERNMRRNLSLCRTRARESSQPPTTRIRTSCGRA